MAQESMLMRDGSLKRHLLIDALQDGYRLLVDNAVLVLRALSYW